MKADNFYLQTVAYAASVLFAVVLVLGASVTVQAMEPTKAQRCEINTRAGTQQGPKKVSSACLKACQKNPKSKACMCGIEAGNAGQGTTCYNAGNCSPPQGMPNCASVEKPKGEGKPPELPKLPEPKPKQPGQQEPKPCDGITDPDQKKVCEGATDLKTALTDFLASTTASTSASSTADTVEEQLEEIARTTVELVTGEEDGGVFGDFFGGLFGSDDDTSSLGDDVDGMQNEDEDETGSGSGNGFGGGITGFGDDNSGSSGGGIGSLIQDFVDDTIDWITDWFN